MYALLAERAEAADLAELVASPHWNEEGQKDAVLNRAELDAMLAQPLSLVGVGELAVIRALGGAA